MFSVMFLLAQAAPVATAPSAPASPPKEVRIKKKVCQTIEIPMSRMPKRVCQNVVVKQTETASTPAAEDSPATQDGK